MDQVSLVIENSVVGLQKRNVVKVFMLACVLFFGCGEPSRSDSQMSPSIPLGGATQNGQDSQLSQSVGPGGRTQSQAMKSLEEHSDAPDFYSVAVYDETRDPQDDLAMTISRIKGAPKRILIQVGGDWCNWCTRLGDCFVEQQNVKRLLENHFVIMKVASKGERSPAFLADYPKIESYPHVYVLSNSGELLHSQDMEELEKDDGYNPDALVEFLMQWSASTAGK